MGNGAILGVHETGGLVAFYGDNDMITPISIDEDATSSYEFSVPYCDTEEVTPAPNGIFEIRNMITGEYLSSSASTDEVFLSDSHLGCDSQWSLEPDTDSNAIWGHIKAVTNRKYLSIENEFVCDPESKNGCADEKANIKLVDDNYWIGRNKKKTYKKLW